MRRCVERDVRHSLRKISYLLFLLSWMDVYFLFRDICRERVYRRAANFNANIYRRVDILANYIFEG